MWEKTKKAVKVIYKNFVDVFFYEYENVNGNFLIVQMVPTTFQVPLDMYLKVRTHVITGKRGIFYKAEWNDYIENEHQKVIIR